MVTQLSFPSPADGIAATYQASAPAGTAPWRLWRSRDGGRTWLAAGALPGGNNTIYGPWLSASGHGLLPLGRDTITGTVSFAGRSGWLVVRTPAFQQLLAVAVGGQFRRERAPQDASDVQLLGHGTGFAWGLESPATPGPAGRSVLVLSRTTDNGRGWRQARITLVAPPGAAAAPLLGFSDAGHGWLVFGGVTWRTSDGGASWS